MNMEHVASAQTLNLQRFQQSTRDTTHRSSKASRQIPCETPHGVRDHLRCAAVGALPSKSPLADRYHHTHETECRFDKQGLPQYRLA